MAYIKITNGVQEPYSIGKLRRDNNNISFPKIIPNDILADYSVSEVVMADRPVIDEVTQVATQNTEATQVNGKWTYEWTVRDKTAEELTEQKAALAGLVREQRDNLLAETDWMALSDVTMSADMVNYRQSLRDITQQAGFPNEVTWPVKPAIEDAV